MPLPGVSLEELVGKHGPQPPGRIVHILRQVCGALREAHEEAGVAAESVGIRGEHVLAHPDWSYTTVLADELVRLDPVVTDAESVEVRWVPLDEVTALPLHPAFADAWPALRASITA